MNQSTPYGTSEWIADANAPGGYTQKISLSADQQAQFNQMNEAQKLALGLTTDQIGRVEQAFKNNPGAPNLQMTLDWQGNTITPGQLQTSVPTGNLNGAVGNVGQQNGTIGNAGQQTGGFAGSGPLAASVNANGQFKGSINPAGDIQDSIGSAGSMQSTFTGGNQALASTVGDLPSMANGYQTPGGLQTNINTGGPLTTTFGQTNVQPSMGPADFTKDREAVTNNVWAQANSRLDPMYGKRQSDLDVTLANRGIGMNSAAYGNAQDIEGRARNDAYNQAMFSAINQGAQEQNTLFNQSLQQGQFANSAAAQQYAQNQGLAQFGNDAQLADFNRSMQAGQFANQAQNQAYLQNQDQAVFQNQAQAQAYDQAMGKAGLQNAAAAQDYAQSQGRAQFQNQAQQQAFAQQMDRGQFANQAQAQQFGQNAAQTDVYNQGILQDTDRQIQVGQFQNQAAAQQFAQNQQQAQFSNDAQAQTFAQEQARAQAANSAQAQQFQQELARTQMQLQAGQAQFQQNYQNALLQNMTQDQAFQQAMAMDQSGFAQQLAASQFGNQSQNQNFQNQYAASNQSLNQLTGLLGLGQVQAPQGLGYTPSQVGQTDVLGGYALNAQQQQAAYNAQMQARSGLMSGLFSLGAAGITAMSDRRLKRDVQKVGTNRDGLGLYLFRYLWDSAVHLGVMAQEVLWVKPEAVKRVGDFFAVDYTNIELEPV